MCDECRSNPRFRALAHARGPVLPVPSGLADWRLRHGLPRDGVTFDLFRDDPELANPTPGAGPGGLRLLPA